MEFRKKENIEINSLAVFLSVLVVSYGLMYLVIKSIIPFYLPICVYLLFMIIYYIFYDEIFLRKYVVNRKRLFKLLKTNPGIIKYSYSSNDIHYFYFILNDIKHIITYRINKEDLAMSNDFYHYIGYFTSTYLQKKIVSNLISKLEEIRLKQK